MLCKFSIPIDCGVQIAVGLMVFQQIGGINGVGFYASETFVAAGKLTRASRSYVQNLLIIDQM